MHGKLEHLGIIIDGNRRYAKKMNITVLEAYKLGADKVYETINLVFGKTDIPEISVYALSFDNLMRRLGELNLLLDVQRAAFEKWATDPLFKEKGICVKFVGELETLPPKIKKSCLALQAATSGNDSRVLNILMAYFGHREISGAVAKILDAKDMVLEKGSKAERLDRIETLIASNLQVKRPVNLIIRTAGGNRLSGFLPWQSEYAELYPLKKYWPEVNPEDIKKAIDQFNNSGAKYGL
jgi:tritrans,polycis-undecaprenyl-diphosphate synthase [geranylgeranyl-diphosphate specific]